jgi:hypothetical protein
MKTTTKALRRAGLDEQPAPDPEPQPTKEAQPMTLHIDPPQGRHRATAQPWAPPRKGGADAHERGKTPQENALQGRVERDPAPLLTLTDELLTTARAQAISRITVAELVETMGAELDPALHGENPRLANVALARALREAAQKWPEYAPLLEDEITQRSSRHWRSHADEATAAEWLGAYDVPPPPPAQRPAHVRAYLAAATLIIDQVCAARPVVRLAYRDPLGGMAHVVDRVPGGESSLPFGAHEARWLTARISEGHLLAFVPLEGMRLVPPDISTVRGASWTSAADGSCYLLRVTE